MSKVFLSYSHKNEAFVENLYRKLTRDGVDCFFDKVSIAWGANWVLELEKGIDECEFIVLILTPAFCQSEWNKIERTSAIADDPAGLKRKLRPLLLEECRDLLPRFLKPIQYIDISTTEKLEKNYPKICSDLGGSMKEVKQFADRKKLPPSRKLPDKHRMPYRSLGKSFIGRVQDLWEINDKLRESKTAVVEGIGIIIGMGGIGKTQLAIEYVHRFGVNYPGGVFWIDAERGISVMIEQIADSAGIDIDSTKKEKEQLCALWESLNRFGPVLIVLDNFPEKKSFQAWLPPLGSIYTLITTRRRDLDRYYSIPLNLMTIEEGMELLNSGHRKFGKEAEILIEVLEGLPLAVELARNFLNLRLDLNVDSLLQEIKRVGEIKALNIFAKKYADELPTGHTKEIAATFKISWDQASPIAKEVLQVMSLLAPTPVPRRMLRKKFEISSESILEDPINEAISELSKKLSLVELDEENDPSMHRLISGFVKTTVKKKANLYEGIINIIIDEMSRVTDEKDIRSFRELEKIAPHAEVSLSSKFLKSEQEIDISNYLRWHYSKWGRYRLAEKYGRKALYLSKKYFKVGHPSIAISQSNLALMLQELGELEEARDLLREALASGQKSVEPGHPEIATRQSNLALVLKELGELEEARDLLREALASEQKSFEPGHPTITISQSNLAMVLKELGELEEARDLLREALASAQKSFEPGHPAIATRQSNLALVLRDLGELEEARDLLREAFASDQKSFEPGHPKIATRQSNLATVLQDLGELEEARDLSYQAYKTFLNIFGSKHPKTKTAKENWELICNK